jgi:phage terminase large subunit GpA-like protein
MKKGQIRLNNGFTLHLMWSGSPSSTSADPMRLVICDEINKFREWSGREADAVTLTEKRLRTFGDRRCQVNGSTPTHRYGRITQLVEASDMILTYHVPCPHCGTFQRLVFGRLKWKKLPTARGKDKIAAAALVLREPGAVWYECAVCGKKIEESEKHEMARRGRWVSADGTVQDAEAVPVWPAGTRLGIQIDPFYVRWISWGDIVAEFLRAEGDLAKTMDFHTQTLGAPFELQVARTDADFYAEKSRRSPLLEGLLPAWTAKVLITIDTQHDHFWVVVRAWGPELRSARIWHGRVETFEELDRICFGQAWPFAPDPATGQPPYDPLVAELVLIDSGGTRLEGDRASRTMQVYTWTLPRQLRVRAVKGASQPRPGMFIWRGKGWLDDEPTHKNPAAVRRHIPLVYLDTGHFADVMASYAAQGTTADDKRPEIWFLNQRDDPEYNHHLSGVAKVVEGRGAAMKEVWKPKQEGSRIDLWDCEVYQAAAAYMAQVHLLPTLEQFEQFRAAQIEETRRAAEAPKSTQERRNPWRPTPFGR